MTHTADSERDKYETVYKFPGYGRVGHALKIAHHLTQYTKPGMTIADFGCGRGASFPPFVAAGLKIIPVDHVDALIPEFRDLPGIQPLVRTNLWDGLLPQVDYGVCTDVMEHIPPDFVDATLKNISESVKHGCLWSICHVADVWGKRIGAPLHLTIEPREWWTARLESYWYVVKPLQSLHGMTVYWTEHLK